MTTPREVEPECFCDGNGSVPCWSCGGEGLVQGDCGDDLCVGTDCIHGYEDVACEVCDGRGEIICRAHNYGDGE